MSFSATDAAFEGFRVVRRAPLSLVFWMLVYLIGGGIMLAMAAPQLASLMALSAGMEGNTEPSFDEVIQVFNAFGAMMALLLPAGLILGAVLSAAVTRAVLRPEAKAWGYVRFGMDELRVLAVQIILGLAIAVLMAAVYAVLAGVGAAAVAMDQPWMFLIIVLGGLAGFGLVIWLAVRWSLAVPITVAEKRIAPFASFRLTKGRFWPLLGMALLACVMTLVVSLLIQIVTFPATLIFGSMDNLAAFDGQVLTAILAQALPMIVAYSVINAISSALQLAVLYAPFTAAYQALKGPA